MAELQMYAFGDRILHAGCPEWGVGTITRVQNLVHEGAACQRLSARFERAGLKTVLTALADIRPAEADAPTTAPSNEQDEAHPGTTDHLEGRKLSEIFGTLPEATRDPFTSLADRVRATLGLYRFDATGGSLLDWASVQARMADPLSRYSRTELEQEFSRFAHNRDLHLKELAREAHRTKDAEAIKSLRSAPGPGGVAVKRLNAAR